VDDANPGLETGTEPTCGGIRGAVSAMMGKDGKQQKTRLQVKGIGKFDLGNKLAGQVFLREQRFTFACTDR